MKTSEKIAKARIQANLTQDQLAELIGVTRQTISKWELDVSLPETPKLLKLSKILQVSIDYLLDENNSNKAPKLKLSKNDADYEIDWSEVCPILKQYESEVDCEHYYKIFEEILEEIEKCYKYNPQDSVVVVKDLLYKAYLRNENSNKK